jgi:glycerol-3-phosphate dehydrogenase (NAD(P)+)
MENITIIGGGSWGTALAVTLQGNGHLVKIWSIMQDEVDLINSTHENKDKLPGVIIPNEIVATTNIEEAVTTSSILVFAVPSIFVRSTAKLVKPFITAEHIVVNVAKGIEESTTLTLTEILEEVLEIPNIAVLSGPSHAEEVGKKIPTTCVVGASKKVIAERIQNTFMNQNFRLYTSPDVIGIEVGGALKNVIALAAGISDGLGFGDNTKAALMTRGMHEISSLGMAMGGSIYTFAGLSGIGDLIVTCTSMHSRNRRCGILLGKGYTLAEATKEVQMVVEGVHSAKAAKALAEKYNIRMPIIEEVCKVLFEDKSPKEAVLNLMLRDKKIEHADIEWEENVMWS